MMQKYKIKRIYTRKQTKKFTNCLLNILDLLGADINKADKMLHFALFSGSKKYVPF